MEGGAAEFGGEGVEFGEFGGGEVESAGGVGGLAGVEFELAGEHGVVVAVAADVVEDGFEVFDLGASVGEVFA